MAVITHGVAPISGLRWRGRGLAAAALAVSAACAHRQDVPSGERAPPVVVSVRILGNEAFEDDEVEKGLATKATGPWPWSEEHRFDPVAASLDDRRIETFYALHGYYSVSAEHDVEPASGGEVRVVFRVREGEPARIVDVAVQGLEDLPAEARRRLQRGLPIETGRIVRAADYEAALARLQLRLRRAGYALAEVTGHVEVQAAQREARIQLTAVPGPLHRYGEIEVHGLQALPEGPLRAIVRRVLRRGGIYRPAEVETAQSRLFDLGAFRSVRVSVERPAAGIADATIRVVVEELPIHAVVLGGGVGIEQNLQQLQAIVEYRNTDFLGGARRLVWSNEGAWRFLPSFYRPEQTGIDAESALELTQPEFLWRTDLALRGSYRRVFRRAYSANALTVRLGLPYQAARAGRLTPGLAFERFLDLEVPDPVGASPLPFAVGCPAPCRLAYASVNLFYDRRDSIVAARRGYLLLADVQYGVPLSGAGFHYLRFEPEVRVYLPMTGALTLATRWTLGGLVTLGATEDSPLPQRFFGGGAGGHRGFGPEQLAPAVQVSSDGFAPVGGNGLWLATIEARYRLSARWGVVAFADYGDVTVDALDIDPATAPLAVGLGGRWYTLAGPVRLDIAYRATRRPRRALDTGASPDERGLDYFTLFFSLGEAF